jgi:cell fate regulator YaaT (PSP1 superfamily)
VTEATRIPRTVSVCFRRPERPQDFDAGDLDLKPGDRVVCRTARGLELGVVRTAPRQAPGTVEKERPESVARMATEADLRRDVENRAREADALMVAAEKVAEHALPMKLIEAEATLDGSRIVIHFSAEGRVDFRALVRDLARSLHARVELHQVGVRDEAKLRGGMGHCGRQLCCATFLTSFDPVGIKMAKEQDLSLNPQKISGVCGRLMCCLSFEYGQYRAAKQGIPKTGGRIETPRGPGKIKEINVPRNRVLVALDEGGQDSFTLAECAGQRAAAPDKPVSTPRRDTSEAEAKRRRPPRRQR